MAVVKGTVRKAVNEHKSRVRSPPRLRPPAGGGVYREAKVEFGHKLSDGNLVLAIPTTRLTILHNLVGQTAQTGPTGYRVSRTAFR